MLIIAVTPANGAFVCRSHRSIGGSKKTEKIASNVNIRICECVQIRLQSAVGIGGIAWIGMPDHLHSIIWSVDQNGSSSWAEKDIVNGTFSIIFFDIL